MGYKYTSQASFIKHGSGEAKMMFVATPERISGLYKSLHCLVLLTKKFYFKISNA